jgi:hypothetical protein
LASLALILLLLAVGMPMAFAATTSSYNGTTPTVLGSDVVLSLVNQNPDPASAGNPVELRVGVQNQGQTTKNNLVVQLIPSYPFSALPGENLTNVIGTLSAFQVDANTQIVKFNMGVDPQATSGTYDLKVWTYTQGSSSAHTETTIPVVISNTKNVQVIYVDKAVLVPGQITPLTFTINNVGKSPLNHLQFRWSTAGNTVLPVNGAADRYIDSLDIGESVNITYDVIASTNANADLYGLNLVLTYDNPISSGQSEFDTVAGVYVGGGTSFAVSYDSGSGASTALNIANTGSNPATAVAVIIPANQTGWRVTGARTSVIGSLAKGDYTIASFNLQGTGRQPLNVEVDYTDTMGNRQSEMYDVEINAASGNTTGGNYTGARNGQFAGAQRSSGTSITTVLLEAGAAVIIIGGIVAGIYAYRKRPVKRK